MLRVRSFFARIRRGLRLIRWRELGLSRESCAVCGFPLLVRLRADEMGVRCLRCGASSVTQSLVDVLQQLKLDLAQNDAYELSAQGPLVPLLAERCRTLTVSEYFPGISPGQWHGSIQCQDVQALTYADARFDLCTSTEVFEHVEDDARGFREVARVLRPGGWFVFSVPLDLSKATVERTALENGVRRNILPPEYHGDRYRGDRVFCYRNYGADILDRLRGNGFAYAEIHQPKQGMLGYARPIVCARTAD